MKNMENILIQVKLNNLASNTDYMLEIKWSLSPISFKCTAHMQCQYDNTTIFTRSQCNHRYKPTFTMVGFQKNTNPITRKPLS